DVPLTIATRDLARAEQATLNLEIARLTDGEITSLNQVEKIKEFIRRHGHTIESLTRRSTSQILRYNPSDTVRQLLELRRLRQKVKPNRSRAWCRSKLVRSSQPGSLAARPATCVLQPIAIQERSERLA